MRQLCSLMMQITASASVLQTAFPCLTDFVSVIFEKVDFVPLREFHR